MAKKYDHKKIEKKWQKEWEKKKVYKTKDPAQAKKQKKFYVLDMFPYPSGEGLHVGHPKGYIATDVVSRMKRMQGYNVLHPMGFDAFGLPAEQYAIKMKTNPMIAVRKNVARYKKQLEILGLDYDWSREVNTTDPKFYKWTQWIFLKLLEKGLAYESYEPINWCPVDKTGLANEDIEDGKCERCGAVVEKRPMRQWVIRITDYAERLLSDIDDLDWPNSIKESQKNWIGKSEGAEFDFKIEDSDEKITVFTTRADTLYGVTYVVLAPENELIKKIDFLNKKEVEDYINTSNKKSEIDRTDATKEKTGVELKGVKAIHPATGERLPIWIADYVLADYGTGAVMAVPAHDDRDLQFARKYNQEIKEVVVERMVDATNPHVPGKETISRDAIIAVVYNPRTDKYLCLKWKKQPWTTFVMGGIENGEDPIVAATREIQEETGYKNIRFIKMLRRAQSEFYAAHKGVNRIAYTRNILFELQSEEMEEVTKEEFDKHEVTWMSLDEIRKTRMTHSEMPIFYDGIMGKDGAYAGVGLLVNSAEFNHVESDTARLKIAEKFGRKVVKYKLRDWVFSRQRYWGEPIPVIRKPDGTVLPLKESALPLELPKVKSYEPTGTGESPLADISNWINVKMGKEIWKRESNTMPQWAGSSWYYLRYMDPKNGKALVDKKKEKYWNEVDLYVGGAEHATRHLIYARFWHKFLYDIGVVSTKEPFRKLQNVGLIMAEDGRKMSKRWGNVVNPDDVISRFGADTMRVYEMFMGPFDQAISWNTDSMIGSRRFIERVWNLQFKVSSKKIPQNKDLEISFNQAIKKVGEDIESMSFNTAISTLMILLNKLEKEVQINKDHFQTLLKIIAPFAPHVADELWSILGARKSIHIEKWPSFDPKLLVSDEVKIAVQVNGKVRGTITISHDLDEKSIFNLAKNNPDVSKWIDGKNVNKEIYVKGRLVSLVVD